MVYKIVAIIFNNYINLIVLQGLGILAFIYLIFVKKLILTYA